MLFASLFTSALAALGSVSAVPVGPRTDVQGRERSLDNGAESAAALSSRTYNEELDTRIEGWYAPQSDRDLAVRDVLGGLAQTYPDYNFFIFHQFHDDFEYSIVGDSMDAQFQVQDWTLKDEYYAVRVFKGAGTLVRKGDGGYANWGFGGVYDVNDRTVTFHPRA